MKAKITEQGVLVITAETKEDISIANKWIKHHRQVYDHLPIMAESVVSGDDKSSKALHKQSVTNRALLLKIQKLEANNKLLNFMVENGLGKDDMINDITYPHEL